jgi:hypothetical protein
MQSHKSWMRKETKSEYDKTKPCKPISHEWEKKQRVNMTKLNHSSHKSWMRKETKSKYDKTKPCKPISHEWEKKQRVNMTKLNHAKP